MLHKAIQELNAGGKKNQQSDISIEFTYSYSIKTKHCHVTETELQ